ncbi:UNVERIFIED_CONTAM: Retrovirus-related Pol polyprotein from transposon TNT 1-94 [Sesamum latifolium]|uniref:Retrovirus-related Pol polyprotein from transposon TNT 1-94 n=1 Tax=Sesamum latifolium TaxID=2727402 RepID=A0AAW2TM02_9LAMI
MVRSMMSFTELPPSFWGYALETAAKLLNIAPSKMVPQTPYEIWHGKPMFYKYLRVWGSPTYAKRLVGDKLDSRSSPCRMRSCLRSQAKNLSMTMQHHLNLRFPLVVFQSSVGQPENLDHLKGIRPIGCKWVYKHKLGADGEVTAFKTRLVLKGYTQRSGVDFEETYSPIAMAKSIRILLAIAAWYDYEIWQMDMKMAFLNGFVEEEIYMDQPEGLTSVGEE